MEAVPCFFLVKYPINKNVIDQNGAKLNRIYINLWQYIFARRNYF